MTFTLADTAQSGAPIPDTIDGVAGYIDGEFRTYGELVARFPNKVHVAIAVQASTNGGDVLDVERFDASPDQAPGWVAMRRKAGRVPAVYMSFSAWDAVKQAFRSSGVADPLYWVAGYATPPDPTIPPGAIAHQYVDTGPYDLSECDDRWRALLAGGGVIPAPKHGGDDVTVMQTTDGQNFLVSDGWTAPLDPTMTWDDVASGANHIANVPPLHIIDIVDRQRASHGQAPVDWSKVAPGTIPVT